jgi:hypothetical protein
MDREFERFVGFALEAHVYRTELAVSEHDRQSDDVFASVALVRCNKLLFVLKVCYFSDK